MNITILRGGNVLNSETGTMSPAHDVVIAEGRIADVRCNAQTPPNAHVIDVTGKTVMPGLIDCHVHVLAWHTNLAVTATHSSLLTSIRALPILEGMLQRGFTSVRDAGGADWELASAVDLGLVSGPRLFLSGKALSQTGGHGDFRPRGTTLEPCSCYFRAGAIARIADGVDNVRLAVREEIQKGAAQIKIMASGGVASPTDPIATTQYSEAEIKAAVEEAQAANTYVMAHAYTPRAISRAVCCGVRTIEHGNLVDEATAGLMAKSSVFAVPTLVTYDALAKFGAEQGLPLNSAAKIESVREAGRKSLEIFASAGVKMGYGSDLLGDMHIFQNDEFLIRAEVLGNLAAIQSATTVAAEILNRSGELGTIRKGALADLIVVDGNPLNSIDVLAHQGQHITHVIKNGEVVKPSRKCC